MSPTTKSFQEIATKQISAFFQILPPDKTSSKTFDRVLNTPLLDQFNTNYRWLQWICSKLTIKELECWKKYLTKSKKKITQIGQEQRNLMSTLT